MINVKELKTKTVFNNAYIFILALGSGGGGNVSVYHSDEIILRDDESEWDVIVGNPSRKFEFCLEPVELVASLKQMKAGNWKRMEYQVVNQNVESYNDTETIDLPNGQRMVTFRTMVRDRWSIILSNIRDSAFIIETEVEFGSVLHEWCLLLGTDKVTSEVVIGEFMKRIHREPVNMESK